jgi:beta-lactam-binding protein with PASTA domain
MSNTLKPGGLSMNIEEEINSDRNHGTLSSTYNAKGNTAQVLDLQAA